MGRMQRVILDGEKSEWRDVLSGIPQGSVLDPLLCVCFVIDLPNVVTSKVLLFADDTKIFTEVLQTGKLYNGIWIGCKSG